MIRSNYADHQTPQFRVLSDGQCQELYLAALEAGLTPETEYDLRVEAGDAAGNWSLGGPAVTASTPRLKPDDEVSSVAHSSRP